MVNVIAGLKEESYKHQFGVDDPKDNSALFECRHMSVTTGKRDWAAFQVLVAADEDIMLTVGDSAAFSPKGPLAQVRVAVELEGFSKNAVNMYHIGFVEDDDRVYKADILLHDETIYVGENRVQPVWVEITVPEDMQSGMYDGKVRFYAHSMFDDEDKIGTLDFCVNVKDVTLPASEDRRFHLDIWQHLSNIARKHETLLWSDAHFRIMEEYVKSLAALGQKAITIIASEIPWSGQRCFRTTNYLSDLFEYNMVKVEKDENGQFCYDFSIVDRYINLCFKYGIDREIEVFGLTNIWIDEEYGYGCVVKDYPDAIRVRYLDKDDGCYKYIKDADGIKRYIKAVEAFFADKGLIDRVLVVADEPADVELYKKRLDTLRQIAPMFKYKTAINHVEFIDEFKDEVQDFVPILPCVCEGWQTLQSIKNEIQGRLLWYVCCWPPLPNTFISSPLLESRLIGLLTAFMDFDGFLRWNYTVWPQKPRERISYRYPNWKAGDTNFVYPAWDGRPLLTLRYKNLKRGIDDYELIHMLKAVHPQPKTILETIWARILRTKDIKAFHPYMAKKPQDLYSLDYDDYAFIKTLILDEIQSCK